LNPAPDQPPTPNAVTTSLSSDGEFNVFNNNGTVGMLIDVNGYYTNASLQELANRLTAAEAAITAAEDAIATNTGDIDGLDAREPFAVTNTDPAEAVTINNEVVVSVDVAAPVAGQVTVNSTTRAAESTGGDGVSCSITTASGLDLDYIQSWESPGVPGDQSQLTGTRTFDIAADATVTYNFVCSHFGTANQTSTVFNSVLTAIFTPAP
jgi:hypothetical protein